MIKHTRYNTKTFILRKIDNLNYHPFMKMSINDKPVRMLIDTGAGITAIGLEFINELGLIKGINDETQTIGVGSSNSITSKITINKFQIKNNFVIKNLVLRSMDLDYINNYYKEQNKPIIHGIIGSDFLNEYNAKIDYKERQIEFSKIEIYE